MTSWYTFIGDPEDPAFYWDPPDERYRLGNLPRAILTGAAMEGLSINALSFMDFVSAGTYDGRQIDWGAWAIRMSGDEMRRFYRETLRRESAEERLAALDAHRPYLLVVVERA